jgi:hypothetical protein
LTLLTDVINVSCNRLQLATPTRKELPAMAITTGAPRTRHRSGRASRAPRLPNADLPYTPTGGGAPAAGGVVVAVPVVPVFAVIRRYLVRGMPTGAVKG